MKLELSTKHVCSKDSVVPLRGQRAQSGTVGDEGTGCLSLVRGETRGKAPPLPYVSPTPRPLSVKIVSKVPRTPRMWLWESHQGGGGFVKVAEKALPRSVRPAGLKKAWDQLALPRAEEPPGEPPAQTSPLTSKPHVNNLPLPAPQTSPRGAALGGRGPDAEPARKAACRPTQPSLDTGLHGCERMSVVPAPTWLPRPSPPASQSKSSPRERWSWGADEGAKGARGAAGGGRPPVSPRGLSPGRPRRVSDEGREGRP